MAIRKVEQIDHAEDRLKLGREKRRILGSHPEGDEGPGIAEHRMPDIRIELVEMLVREREAQSVLAQLGHHLGEGERREGLEFVHVQEERWSLIGGCIRPAERGEAERSDQQPAEDVGTVDAQFALRQVHDQDATLIHDRSEPQVDLLAAELCGRVEDGPEALGGFPDLILDRDHLDDVLALHLLAEGKIVDRDADADGAIRGTAGEPEEGRCA